jgi:DnaJ-domain-containing protein 1
MPGWWTPKHPDGGQSENARAATRFTASGLSCVLGDIEDISASGIRVRCASNPSVRPGDVLELTLRRGSGTLRTIAKVAWIKVPLFRAASMGLRFVDKDAEALSALLEALCPGHASEPSEQGNTTTDSQKPADPVTVTIDVEDLYAIVGVPRTATENQIREAFRTLAKTLHPDMNPDPAAQQRFAAISKAYAVLRDPAHRARYDRLLSSASRAA